MATTPIEWTATVNADGSVTPGKVWNPVTGCHKVSPGCKHCYAEGIAKRFWKTQYPPIDGRPRVFTDVQCHPDRLTEPLSWKKPCKVFVNSMSDLFEESVPFEFIDQVFAVMALCPHITFILLTKRPARMRDYFADLHLRQELIGIDAEHISGHDRHHVGARWQLPLRNVWLLVSVENQPCADDRIPILLATPAAVRGISYEPALGPISIKSHLHPHGAPGVCADIDGYQRHQPGDPKCGICRPALDWVIVGGESGPGARPFHIDWARQVVHQGHHANVPVFVKQLGTVPICDDSDLSTFPSSVRFNEDDGEGAQYFVKLADRKGGEMAEWPADLRVRQFPQSPIQKGPEAAQ